MKYNLLPNNKFEKIKSKYILQKIFDNLNQAKSLKIIKYNKNIQNRFNLSINYYKEYSQIEIEIKLIGNKYCKFININNKEDEKYYHIYFNNNDKEEVIKNYYLKEKDDIKNIKIIIDHQVKSLYKLFYGCEYIESIYFKKFNRSNITNMSFMFYG